MSKPDLAIFDLDNTILNGDSDYSMINYLIDINLLGKNAKLKNEQFIQDYQRGQLDFNQYTNFALKPYIGMTQKEINEIIMPFVENIIEPMINIFALKLLHEHYEKDPVPWSDSWYCDGNHDGTETGYVFRIFGCDL